MSARVVVNLSHGLASSAIDRDPDGDNWLSLWQLDEVVVVKLSSASTRALWLALSKELGMLDPGSDAPGEMPAQERAASLEPASA